MGTKMVHLDLKIKMHSVPKTKYSLHNGNSVASGLQRTTEKIRKNITLSHG
jgi:hypothetical protein